VVWPPDTTGAPLNRNDTADAGTGAGTPSAAPTREMAGTDPVRKDSRLTSTPRSRGDVLRQARQRDSRAKRSRAISVVDRMLSRDEPVTFSAVAN
jgi:hypothetical protein